MWPLLVRAAGRLMLTAAVPMHVLAQSPASAHGTVTSGIPHFRVGGSEISGGFVRPFKSRWREWEIGTDGTRRETSLYSDELTFETVEGRQVIRNVQRNVAGNDGLVILLDRKTLAPLWTEQRDDSTGSFVRTVYHNDRVDMTCAGSQCPAGVTSSGLADTVRKTTPINEPVFDFFTGSYGLLLAALPLSEGLVATLPVYSPAVGFLRLEVHVGPEEVVEAGAGRRVRAWPVTVSGTRYLFHVSKEVPHWIRLITTRANGTIRIYSR